MPISNNVRYASDSDHSRHWSELTRCAIRTEACVIPPSMALDVETESALWERLWERYGHRRTD
jgi:hypothetical protein